MRRDFSSIVFFLILAILSISEPGFSVTSKEVGLRWDASMWKEYVPRYRRGHNFALSATRSEGSWEVGNFGELRDRHFSSQGIAVKIRYAYAIGLWRNFGYFLGSTLGFQKDYSSSSEFSPGDSIHLPGFYTGLGWDFSPALRFHIGYDIYLERLDGMKTSQEGISYTLDATMLTWLDSSIAMDVFFDLNVGARAELHARRVSYSPMLESVDEVESARFTRSDYWIGLGILYHVL